MASGGKLLIGLLNNALFRSIARNSVALAIGLVGGGMINSVTRGDKVEWLAIFDLVSTYVALGLLVVFGILEFWVSKLDREHLSSLRQAKDEARMDQALDKLWPSITAHWEKEIQAGRVTSLEDLKKRLYGNG